MSVEVRLQSYKFTPDCGNPKDDNSIWKRVASRVVKPRETTSRKVERRTWFYNPLHDFESIFWLTLNFLANKDVYCVPSIPNSATEDEEFEEYAFEDEPDEERRQRILSYWNFGRTLFAGRSGRVDVLCVDGTLSKFLDDHPLHPALVPLADLLVDMRTALVNAYRRVEADASPITHRSAPELSRMFGVALMDVQAHLKRVRYRIEVRSLKQAVDALPKSYQDQRTDAPPPPLIAPAPTPTEGASASSNTKRRRIKVDDEDEYVDSNKRKSKSPRTSVDHKSPTSRVPTSKSTKSVHSGRGKQKGRKRNARKAKGRKPRRGQAVSGSAPIVPPLPLPLPLPLPPPQANPEPDAPPTQPKPPTRVLRSHTRGIIASKASPPPASPVVARARKETAAATIRKPKGAAKAKETAKVAAKVATKAKPKSRRRKG